MRIQIRFKTEKIPIDYRLMIISLIKESIKKVDFDYFNELYSKEKQVNKPYTFALKLGEINFTDKDILTDNIVITISSGDYKFLAYLQNGLLNLTTFKYKDYIMEKISLYPTENKKIITNSIICKAISPFFIYDSNQKPISPSHEDFNEFLNNSLSAMFNKRIDVKFEPINLKKRIVKEMSTKNNGNFLKYETYVGTFKLSGTREDLQILYDYGMSQRRAQGYGLFEIIKEG